MGDSGERAIAIVQVEGICPLVVCNKQVKIAVVVKISPDAIDIAAFVGDDIASGDSGEVGLGTPADQGGQKHARMRRNFAFIFVQSF